MLRRDFFKAISAAAAAIAAAPVAIASANTRRFSSRIRDARASLPPPDDTLAFVRRLLKECRVVSHEVSMSAGELTRCRVCYRHDPNGRQTREDREWEEYLADAKMVSVVVSTTADEVDVTHLGARPVSKATRDVEIEYVMFPKRSQA